MWADYLSEFASLHEDAERILAGGDPSEGVEVRQQKLDALMKKMKRCFSSLEMNVRSLQPRERQPLEASLMNCRRQFTDIERRTLLLREGSRGSGQPSASKSRQNTFEKLKKGSSQLEESLRLAAEAEGVGESALCSLYVQRETLSRTMTRTKDVQRNMDEADTIVTKMSKWWNGIW
ncbi:snare region anchored in the vesicle membrane carboxy-terminal protein [Toxoplasma gondii p89]|uniref:Snare region anchored in the vesicle membrane carboxy-terminal protein n=1 Tax=Toxoplasma gondii p89 TaxID=943119 RepID=A0A086J976_TOXGO|nr:snare region anchored in the vesicle membrane carboxy-terminal protein [Toxoplasma gondii p89]